MKPGDSVTRAVFIPRVSAYRSHAIRSIRGGMATMWCGERIGTRSLKHSGMMPCEECTARIAVDTARG